MKVKIKFLKYFFVGTLLLAFLIMVVAAYQYIDILKFHAEKDKVRNNEFIFLDRKPFGQFKIGNYSSVAVIDTGATQNMIKISKIENKYLHYVKESAIGTVFDLNQYSIYRADEFYVLGRKASDNAIRSSEKSKVNVIGSPEIFSRDRVLISKSGLFYDNEIDQQIHLLDKIPIKVSVDRGRAGFVYAVYYQILIDGLPERVLLDTGISDLITATRPVSDDKKIGTTKIKFIGTAGGIDLVRAKMYQANIQIGDKKIETDYLAFNDWVNPRAKFYLGSEILNYYSLYFDFKKNQFFLIDVKN